MEMNVADQLIHTTARIECQLPNGKTSRGTGFFFNFCNDGDLHVPALVTNWHVVKGSLGGKLQITARGSDGGPSFGDQIEVSLPDAGTGWVRHPDPDIDLVALPIAGVLQHFAKEGKTLFYKAVDRGLIAKKDDLSELVAVEEIVMIGYPIGLWDPHNNLPIVRRGITATPLYIDHNGRSEFVIDCAVFPGSSGSPVYLFNASGYFMKGGGVSLGGRLKFIGVLYSGPRHTSEGAIEVVPIPTNYVPISKTPIPINLGYCIKAEKLLAFEEHFGRLVAAERAAKDQVELAERAA